MPPNEAEPPQSSAENPLAPNPSNNVTMFQIFQNVQYNVVQHKKYVKEMTKLYKKMAETSFRESFKNALYYLFTFGDTSPNVDRVIQFVATFCTSLDDEEEFLLFIFDIIFNCQCVSGQSVRYRASQLLAAVLSALGDDASLDDDLCDKLLASQMQRLQDTRGAVRCRAALALQRLQNPMDPDDEVTRAYRFHMSCDPSSSVRRAVVMSIAKCARNVPFVLERLCDVDEAVRRAAHLYVAAVNVTQLRVKQRVLTLKVGLTERSPRVRRVVEEILIPGWLSAFQGDMVRLLKAIRLDNGQDAKNSQEVAGKLLESLFKRLPISELLEWLPTDKTLRLIPAEKLNKETAWYWRHLAEHLLRIDDEETLETVVPDLVVLTGYIKAIVESPCPSESEDPVGFSTRQHVLRELACLLRVYDARDQAGRSALQELVTDVLTGDYGPLNDDVIRAFVASLNNVVGCPTTRLEAVCGVLAALREPPEPDAPPPPPPATNTVDALQRARLRVSLNVAMEAEEEAVREQNYALAEECKAKVKDIKRKLEEMNMQAPPPPPPVVVPTIREKISDAATLNKCLVILNCSLDTPHLTEITPMMQMIFNDLEVEIFQNPDILENALETVALYGMLDKNFAKENKAFFFANLIDTSNEQIVTKVLRCLVDLLCVHGAKVFEDDDVTRSDSLSGKETRRKRVTYDIVEEDGSLSESAISLSQNHSTVIELLLKILESACSEYRLIIAEGLCRLLHLGHLESPTILTRLLLLWFNPATVEEDMLRQTIGVFFQSFASTVEGAQEQIQKATIPTLRALANAPSSSPLAEIDQEAVIRFIVSLTKINHELTDSGGCLAMSLCSHLVQRPTAPESALVCRTLSLLSPPRDATVAGDLARLLRALCEKMPDKQSARNLTRYLGALEASERASMNKMSQTGFSNTGVTEGTLAGEDTLLQIGRATTSLPQPIARSTHVVINETVEEEVEIDETSPVEAISRISEEPQRLSIDKEAKSPASQPRTSTGSEKSRPSDHGDTEQDSAKEFKGNESDSSGVSPVKKAKGGKGKKKKLSITRKDSDPAKAKAAKGKGKGAKEKTSEQKETEGSDNSGGGVKRSRSQRSLVDVDRAKSNKSKPDATKPAKPSPPESPKLDLDVSNITVRRSTRGLASSSSTESTGSSETEKGRGKTKKGEGKKGAGKSAAPKPSTRITRKSLERQKSTTPAASPRSTRSSQASLFEDSADETELHTIVYDQGLEERQKSTTPTASPRSTRSSQASLFEDSADETELHTIVYDQGLAQSLLDDSSELADSKNMSKTGNVTIPETPDGSEESESDEEIITVKGKGKGNTKRK
ncbi:condensin complex subunit 3 [Plutella xylostella]|uniref:condensin complex subunit 3 n=1 Tax=Plutella xylostella TaxID=51655 RepID=UPI00203222F4|nr:condensin complex subunit 3 [Plutella xylostella]